MLVMLTLLLAVAAAAILIGGSRDSSNARGEEFQRLVGGITSGPDDAQELLSSR